MKTIIYNNKCKSWTGDRDFDQMIINGQIDYLQDYCRFRGFIYLDRIYETFGVEWDPDDKNICYRQDKGGIEFKVESIDNGNFKIYIS